MCPNAMANLQETIDSQLALGITNKPLANPVDVSSATCNEVCTSSSFIVGDINWQSGNSQEEAPAPPEPERELIEVGVAPRQDSGDCGYLCAECTEYFWSDDVFTPVFQCTKAGDGNIRYGNPCSATRKPRHCGSGDQPCLWSYPNDDPDKWRSAEGACRNLPDDYNSEIGINDDWDFQSRVQKDTKGLCGWTGCSGTCHKSWPAGDPLKGKSPYNLVRCWPA